MVDLNYVSNILNTNTGTKPATTKKQTTPTQTKTPAVPTTPSTDSKVLAQQLNS